MLPALTAPNAGIPSPDSRFFEIPFFGIWTFQIHYYALFIVAGIIIATILTNARLTRRGAEPWVVVDICIFAVPLAFVFARIWHVATHPTFYFGVESNPWNPMQPGSVWAIWEGGIAIFGALLGGAIGAFIGCRVTGIRFFTFADALAPGLLLAQGIGRFGNYVNQELFGGPTDLPWGLQIDPSNPAIPLGLAPGTLFHPTFLYEAVWNFAGVCVLLWLSRTFRWFQWGRLFAVYLMWYGAGRVVWENIRIDPSEIILGLRSNVWGAVVAIVLGIAIFVVQRWHTGDEPSPYRLDREGGSVGVGGAGSGVSSPGDTDEYVDTSPPESASVADSRPLADATSSSAS